MRVSTTQALQEQVRETPLRYKLDIAHPASEQTPVQPDNMFVLAVLKPGMFLFSGYHVSPLQLYQNNHPGNHAANCITGTNPNAVPTTNGVASLCSQGRGEVCDTFQDGFLPEENHVPKGTFDALSPFSPYPALQLVRVFWQLKKAPSCLEGGGSTAFAIHSSSGIKKLRRCLPA